MAILRFLNTFDLLPATDSDPNSAHIVNVPHWSASKHYCNQADHDAVVTVLHAHDPDTLRRFLDPGILNFRFNIKYECAKATDPDEEVEMSSNLVVKRAGTVVMGIINKDYDIVYTLRDDLRKWRLFSAADNGLVRLDQGFLAEQSKELARLLYIDELWKIGSQGHAEGRQSFGLVTSVGYDEAEV